jgi:hypothetical protein
LKLDVGKIKEKGISVDDWCLLCIVIHKLAYELLGARDCELAKGRDTAQMVDEERGIHEEWE